LQADANSGEASEDIIAMIVVMEKKRRMNGRNIRSVSRLNQ
jgi:hypothetical protein